jgi:hypothetical protein
MPHDTCCSSQQLSEIGDNNQRLTFITHFVSALCEDFQVKVKPALVIYAAQFTLPE